MEGAHLLLLNHNFRRWRNVRFPEPLLVSEGVLVESWEDGMIISDFIARYSKWREVGSSSGDGKEGGKGGGARGNGMCGAVFGAYTHLQQYLLEAAMKPLRPVLQVVLPAGGAPVGESSSAGGAGGKERRPSLSVELAHFIVSVGEDLYLKMLLVDNLMHGAWGGWGGVDGGGSAFCFAFPPSTPAPLSLFLLCPSLTPEEDAAGSPISHTPHETVLPRNAFP